MLAETPPENNSTKEPSSARVQPLKAVSSLAGSWGQDIPGKIPKMKVTPNRPCRRQVISGNTTAHHLDVVIIHMTPKIEGISSLAAGSRGKLGPLGTDSEVCGISDTIVVVGAVTIDLDLSIATKEDRQKMS